MKEKLVPLLVIAFSILFISSNAQEFNKKDISLCFYNVSISNELGIMPNKAIGDSVFKLINTVLKDSTELNFNSIDALKDKVPYLFGFPIGSAKKAAKSKISNNYAKIVVEIQPVGFFSNNTSTSFKIAGIGKENKKTKTRIKVSIDLELYNDNGDKIKEVEAKVSSKSKIEVDSKYFEVGDFSFINQVKNSENFISIQEIIQAATIELVKNYNSIKAN